MTDDRFEEFLQQTAQGYNEPPAKVPHEEMFAAITAARRSPAPTAGRGAGLRPLVWAGMAATLVIGVAIGRFALTGRQATTPAVASGRDNANARRGPSDSSGTSYAVAATDELARAEALLTAYNASGTGSGVDRQLSTWARDILSNTRLLLDSPAAVDPARRRLLEDLELVLVQMVQRSPAAGAQDERMHIDRSLERTQVLSRLRAALPAGRDNGT